MSELKEDSTDGPYVYRCGVNLRAEEHLGCPVPKSGHFVGVRLVRKYKSASHIKIRDLNKRGSGVDEYIAWFEISVHYTSLMAVFCAL